MWDVAGARGIAHILALLPAGQVRSLGQGSAIQCKGNRVLQCVVVSTCSPTKKLCAGDWVLFTLLLNILICRSPACSRKKLFLFLSADRMSVYFVFLVNCWCIFFHGIFLTWYALSLQELLTHSSRTKSVNHFLISGLIKNGKKAFM